MLNQTVFSTLRATSAGSLRGGSAVEMMSRRLKYPNERARNLKYKSRTRERAKQHRRDLQAGIRTPQDRGEEMPPFFQQARAKLLFKCIKDLRNNNRFVRKPMPKAELADYIAKSKDFAMYKQCEKQVMDEEAMAYMKKQMFAYEGLLMLPDYLKAEAKSDTGETLADAMGEFTPAALYLEQLIRIFPLEFTNRMRTQPAYEETLMQFDDTGKGGRKG